MTASLAGTNGFADIPTTALDLPLVQRLRRSPRLMGPGPQGPTRSGKQHYGKLTPTEMGHKLHLKDNMLTRCRCDLMSRPWQSVPPALRERGARSLTRIEGYVRRWIWQDTNIMSA